MLPPHKTCKRLPREPFVVSGRQRPCRITKRSFSALLGFVLVGSSLLGLTPVWANEQGLVRNEVISLLGLVEHSGCSFMRNGSWHSAVDARKMLEHKLNDAMRDPTNLPSAEHFIAKLASRSSMSGKPYQVKCADAKTVESGPWLMNKLTELRASAPHKPATSASR